MTSTKPRYKPTISNADFKAKIAAIIAAREGRPVGVKRANPLVTRSTAYYPSSEERRLRKVRPY